MQTTPSSLTTASDSASPSASDRHSVHAVALKLPEFWPHVWFAQTEAKFSIKAITCSLTKFHYYFAALGKSDAA